MPYKDEEQRRLSQKRYRLRKKTQGATDLEGFLKSIGNCNECHSSNPAVYVTEERIPLCREHWEMLGNSDIEW